MPHTDGLPREAALAVERAPAKFGAHIRGGVTVVTNRTAAGVLVWRCVAGAEHGHPPRSIDPFNYSEFDGVGLPAPGEGKYDVMAATRKMTVSICEYIGPTKITGSKVDPISPTQNPQKIEHLIAKPM